MSCGVTLRFDLWHEASNDCYSYEKLHSKLNNFSQHSPRVNFVKITLSIILKVHLWPAMLMLCWDYFEVLNLLMLILSCHAEWLWELTYDMKQWNIIIWVYMKKLQSELNNFSQRSPRVNFCKDYIEHNLESSLMACYADAVLNYC